MTLVAGRRSVRLERCPVTDSQHGINHASAVPAHSTPSHAAVIAVANCTIISEVGARFG